jgi:RimJ/RimL family protein N-acetyltransferase
MIGRLTLRPLAITDLWLYEATYGDERMMEHLGGALRLDGLDEKLARDVASTEADEIWVLVIQLDDGSVAGTVAIWDHDFGHETLTEVGWMVLPAYQGRGVGKAAVRAALDRARETGRWRVIHAYPPVSNLASNAMCRTIGFTFVEERDFDYRGHALRCNDWVIDLRAEPEPGPDAVPGSPRSSPTGPGLP